jgi:hypothetical protein
MQPGDRESGPVGPEVLAPGRSAFANGQMSWGDVAFDADLVANVLGDLPAWSDPKNCFGYMIERRAVLFRVVWVPDGMIYDYVSQRSAT